jgi:hypothetical protein
MANDLPKNTKKDVIQIKIDAIMPTFHMHLILNANISRF